MTDTTEIGFMSNTNTISFDTVQEPMLQEVKVEETNKSIHCKNPTERKYCLNRIIKKMKNYLNQSNKVRLPLFIRILCILSIPCLTTIAYLRPVQSSIDRNLLWYQNEIIYEINVPMYRDSNQDGIGDLQGIIEKLDYLEKNHIQSILLQSSIFNVSNELFELLDRQYTTIRTTDLLKLDPQIGAVDDFIRTLTSKKIHLIIDLPLSSTSDHKDLTWYGFNISSPIEIKNPCQYNRSDLGCKYYQIYKQLPLDFSNQQIADTAESRLRYWLIEKKYQWCSHTIHRWKALIKHIEKETTPKLLLFDIPFDLQKIINNQSLFDDLTFSTSLKSLSRVRSKFNSTNDSSKQRFWQTGFSREHLRLGMMHNISQRIVHTLGMLISGTSIVLYGDELGIKQRKDSWMVWTSDLPYGGFSTCSTEKCQDILSSYDTDYLQTNVQSAEITTDPDNESLLLFFRRLSKLRQYESFRNNILKIDYEPSSDIFWFIREAPGHRGFLIAIHSDQYKQEPIHISLRNLTNRQIPDQVYYEYRSANADLLPLSSFPIDVDNLIIFPGSIHILRWSPRVI